MEIQLDEIKEQYNNVIRNSNSKAQQKKMAFLERNLEQLTLVQKQVCLRPLRSFLGLILLTSSSTRTLRSRKRLVLPNASSLPAMSAYRTWKLSFKMPTAGSRSRTRSSKPNYRPSRNVSIRLEVCGALVANCLIIYLCQAQKAASTSPLTFGRIAKPLRGGGGSGNPTSVPVPISGGGGSANPLARVQGEDAGYVLDLTYSRDANCPHHFYQTRR